MIQARWRAYVVRKAYLHKYKCIQRMQANILTRNYHRVYLDMRKNTQIAQTYIKRFLAMLWYSKIRKTKDNLETHIASINQMIDNYNVQASEFQHQFPHMETAKAFNYLNNFEQHELARADKGETSALPQLGQLNEDYSRLLQEN